MGPPEQPDELATRSPLAPQGAGGRTTFSLSEAAAFLRMHPEELRKRAKAGRIPGAKIGRAWVFLEDDLVAHLRAHYPSPRQALQVTLGKEVSKCHFANAETSGGSPSRPPTGNEYDDLLGLAVKPSRKNSTTK